MAEAAHVIEIQVCYAELDNVVLREVTVKAGTTIDQAIEASNILQHLPATVKTESKKGIFGKLKPGHTVLRNGDRIEIYRPLIADPKDSRRRRAEKKDLR